MPSSIEDVEEAHQQIPHSVWLEGPEYSARQIGVRGIAYETYLTARPTTVPPHVLIFYTSADTPIYRRIRRTEERAQVRTGDVSLHPAATRSRWRWRNPIHVLHVYISPALMRAVAREFYAREPGVLKLKHSLRVEDGALSRLSEELVSELAGEPEPGAGVAVRALGDQLVVHLLRRHVSNQITDTDRVSSLRSFVAAHLGEPLDLDQLAAHIDVGRHHLCRLFRDWYDMSPMEYVREQRLEEARWLLEATDEPIGEIALQVGFSDQSHLTRWFKRHFGQTPGRWRQRRGVAISD